MQSPKNPYRVEIVYSRPIKGIGSVESYTGSSSSGLIYLAGDRVKQNGVDATVTIHRNMLTYPEFDWVLITHLQFCADGSIYRKII